MPNELTNALIIERYKFIQQKQVQLDTSLHSNISLFVKILVTLSSVVLAVATYHLKEPEVVNLDIVKLLLSNISLLVFFVSFFFLFVTISNIFAWLDYRNDEVELLREFGEELQRKKPNLKRFLSWQETWFCISLILIILITFGVWFNTESIGNLLGK